VRVVPADGAAGPSRFVVRRHRFQVRPRGRDRARQPEVCMNLKGRHIGPLLQRNRAEHRPHPVDQRSSIDAYDIDDDAGEDAVSVVHAVPRIRDSVQGGRSAHVRPQPNQEHEQRLRPLVSTSQCRPIGEQSVQFEPRHQVCAAGGDQALPLPVGSDDVRCDRPLLQRPRPGAHPHAVAATDKRFQVWVLWNRSTVRAAPAYPPFGNASGARVAGMHLRVLMCGSTRSSGQCCRKGRVYRQPCSQLPLVSAVESGGNVIAGEEPGEEACGRFLPESSNRLRQRADPRVGVHAAFFPCAAANIAAPMSTLAVSRLAMSIRSRTLGGFPVRAASACVSMTSRAASTSR